MNPLVSVILPVYNGARLLPEALDSIHRQGYAPLEILVIDDGSTDETAAVVRAAPGNICYVYQANAGPAAARNRGIGLARGEFLAFLDADDQWPAGKLETQAARLASEPGLDVVTGRIQYVALPGADELRLGLQFEGPERTVTHVHLGAAVFRRRVFDRVGLFDPELRYSEDVDWYLRAREEAVTILILDRITLLYRLHPGNMTREKGARDLMLAKVLKRSLDRRRRKSGGRAAELPYWSELDERRRSGAGDENPLVSVIIPVYNGERYLAAAIESALAQTYAPVQVLVVDDGSSDRSREIAGSYSPRVACYWQPNGGAAAARNLGVRQAQGSLLAFLDADDLWPPDKLGLQVAVLKSQPDCDMVFGCVRRFSCGAGLPAGAPAFQPAQTAESDSQPGYVPGTMLVRREAFLAAGYFNPEFRMGEFIDWYDRARQANLRGVLLPQVLLSRRIHSSNLGVRERAARGDYARVLKAALDRRRRSAGEGVER